MQNILGNIELGKRGTQSEEAEESDVDEQQFKNEDFDEVSDKYTGVKKQKVVVKKEVCILCAINLEDYYSEFYKILSCNIRDQGLDSIFELMKRMYDKEILPNLEENGTLTSFKQKELTSEDIKSHFLYCVNEPLIEYYLQIKQYKVLRDMLLDHVIQSNASDDKLFDYKAMDNIRKLNEKILRIYSEKPGDALFASDNLNLQ